MFQPTHELRFSNSRQRVSFCGFTKERFKTLYLDPAQRLNAQEKVYSYTNKMNQDLMDLSDPAVQNALHGSFRYAESAAVAAAEYFARRPTRFHALDRMEKIFERHFKNKKPTDEERRAAQDVFERTAAGLQGNVVISDLFAGADRFNDNRGLTWGAEGQVAFDQATDDLYVAEMRKEGALTRMNDIMRQFLSTAGSLEIYLDFSLMKRINKFQMARIIVHEATHKFAFTGDYAYMHDTAKFGTLSKGEALKNADSYAYAAISVQEESALTPEKMQRLGTTLVP